jgi:hypothetical protein
MNLNAVTQITSGSNTQSGGQHATWRPAGLLTDSDSDGFMIPGPGCLAIMMSRAEGPHGHQSGIIQHLSQRAASARDSEE